MNRSPNPTDLDATRVLRRDLNVLGADDLSSRYRIIACDISQTFTRTTAKVWSSFGRRVADTQDWSLARAAGWTRTRDPKRRAGFSPLAVQIPLADIGRFAARCDALAWWLFSPTAVMFWIAAISVAALTLLIQMRALAADLARLPEFLSRSDPSVLLICFVSTKIAHELGHAMMCHRAGARPGRVGVFLFCGIPCPYCDVTDIWRESSSIKRAAVMVAGIYVELVIASLAVGLWCVSEAAVLQMHAVNVIVVCSVSTILFNANPLMRYDGYYVLSDLIDSANLRQESATAFREQVMALMSFGRPSARTRCTARSAWLAVYHLASSAYRLTVMFAIAGVVLWLFDRIGVGGLGVAVIAAVAMRIGVGRLRRIAGVVLGRAPWDRVPAIRRYAVSGCGSILLSAILFYPLPAYQHATGFVDAADATTIYLPAESRLIDVGAEIGDPIAAGQWLASVDDTAARLEMIRCRTVLAVADLEAEANRTSSSRHGAARQRWLLAQSKQQAARSELQAAQADIEKRRVVAPHDGWLIPVSAKLDRRSMKLADQTRTVGYRLRDQRGRSIAPESGWCRLARDQRMVAVLTINAEQRDVVTAGYPVTVSWRTRSGRAIRTRIGQVSAADRNDTSSLAPAAVFQMVCPLPEFTDADLMADLGATCRAVVHLPRRSLFDRAKDALIRWIE